MSDEMCVVCSSSSYSPLAVFFPVNTRYFFTVTIHTQVYDYFITKIYRNIVNINYKLHNTVHG